MSTTYPSPTNRMLATEVECCAVLCGGAYKMLIFDLAPKAAGQAGHVHIVQSTEIQASWSMHSSLREGEVRVQPRSLPAQRHRGKV